MTFIANGRYDVLRSGENVSYTGDVSDGVEEIIFSSLRGSVLQVNRTVLDEAQRTTGVVVELVGRFPPGSDIRPADQLRDVRSGVRFVVEDVYTADSAFAKQDIRLALSTTQ